MNDRRNAFVSWAKRAAIDVPRFAAGTSEPGLLNWLDKVVAGKRLVYLGEPDHFNLEKFDFRLSLIRCLFELGWQHIGMEIGRSAGRNLDRYLETGEHKYLEHKEAPSPEDVAVHGKKLDFVKEEGLRFIELLRSISESRPPGTDGLHYFGYDLDLGAPRAAYQEMRLLLGKHRSTGCVRDLLGRLERVPDETTEQELRRLSSVLTKVVADQKRVVDCLGEDDFREFRQWLVTLRDSIASLRRTRWAQNPRENLKWGARRECAMFRHMIEFVSALPPGERVILMGHNYHLSKDFTQLRMAPGRGNIWGWRSRIRSLGYSLHAAIRRYPLDRMWGCSLGTLLSTMFPDQVLSIWMLYGHGELMGRKGPVRVRLKSDTIEALLAEVGQRFLLPLDQAGKDALILLEDANFRGPGGYYGSGNLCAQADALFFVRTVSQSRCAAGL